MMDFDLKQVFSILDENEEGQIQLRRFVDVANNYYSDAEVSTRYFSSVIETSICKRWT
jgi:Ca2+-binding EF-hand superfamily protein